MANEIPKLNPCPFCGGSGSIRRDTYADDFGVFYFVECSSCGGRSRELYANKGSDCPETYQTVRNNWNTRTAPDYETVIGDAGDQYVRSVAYNNSHTLPAMFRWAELWVAMNNAAKR